MEYKFTPLAQLKMSDKGPGTIEGLRAVFDIDEGADLIVKGAFDDTIPEYLESGFSAHSHQWNFSEAVGFPVEAYETERGLYVKSQFHSTPDAQDIRTKAKERMKAGKTVGFSFGYSVKDSDVIRAHEYERELPRYVSSDRLQYNLSQAKRFPQIRLLKKLIVIEDSIVTAPMNKLARATSVKGGLYALSEAEVWAMRRESCRVRNSALRSLYGLGEYKSGSDLRRESESLRRRVEHALRQLEKF
jgi:HK97 family phage prohead protease